MLLALASLAHALDAARVAPALEARFAPTDTYLDCAFHRAARTCVLIPRASDMRSAYADVLAFARALPGVASIDRQGAPSSLAFVVGDTAYHLTLDRSRARPGAVAATLTYAFDRQSAFNVACLRTEALFDEARLASLSPAAYAAMGTAVACHGADPVDARSRTPLVMAVNSRNLDAVEALLRGGGDPNHITQSGWTPLLFAARNGTPAILDALLRAGADPSYIAPDGTTVGTLEPFNPRLSAASDAFAVSGPGSRIPVALAGVSASVAAPASGVGAAGRVDPTRAQETGRARETGAPGAGTSGPAASSPTGPVSTAPAPTAPAPATPVSTAPAAAPSGDTARLPMIALELLALGTVASLAVVRVRRHEPATPPEADPVPVTSTPADLPAMPVPSPFRRQRSHRRLEPDPRSDERTL